MKRSKSIKLVVMATTSVTLAGCSQEPDLDGRVYKSEAECVADSYVSDELCAEVIQTGEQVHAASGPRYNSMSLCTEQHGANACTTGASDGTSFFTPFAVGYFVANAANGGLMRNSIRPIYPERGSRRYYTSGGYYVGSYDRGWRTYNDAVKAPPKPAKVQTRTSIASRGGFGSRSSSGSRGG
ncbi:MAG: DUF1190 domain-containing protein [Roseibium sp.]|uniref:DUF1190 domain-containing protein n=1 Tax=Roseibium sp. TaxID=1936156 RepID=UPI001B265092|nr:DUF1190 domain-containing protein [Roseibium sp.]MBO6510078.1 DUF1190 domain-containing protein [Roseibium sp.]MBO6893894.1 DUF1190 domain-containing protein [Roseibium sp.]MBO6931401.1 DUF1190 domain-containing protein [Roseibium sp.]